MTPGGGLGAGSPAERSVFPLAEGVELEAPALSVEDDARGALFAVAGGPEITMWKV